MAVEIKIPEVGESVTEALVARWLKAEGQRVERDEPVVELETDKVNVEVPAPAAGVLVQQLIKEGQTAKVGSVLGMIDPAGAPAAGLTGSSPAGAQTPPSEPPPQRLQEKTPVAAAPVPPAPSPAPAHDGEDEVVPMSPIRKRIAQRLIEAQQTAALLTTINEIDMSAVMALRKEHQDAFQQRHGIKLGLMSFFVKAAVDALTEFPALNAEIRDQDIVYHHYHDIGIAVSTERGLTVPVLRNAGQMTFADIERAIADFAERAQQNKLKLEELQGGTFTITNGGVFGSLLSTPIVNPPQSGVLGMHTIRQRPVARDGQVVIRPMMYVALTYDHRLIDGREAVMFLKRIVETVEQPLRLLVDI